jgi:hypothetical protein
LVRVAEPIQDDGSHRTTTVDQHCFAFNHRPMAPPVCIPPDQLKQVGSADSREHFAFIEGRACSHYYPNEAGDPLFDIRQGQQRMRVPAPVQGQALVKCLHSTWQWLRNRMETKSDAAAPY